MYVLLLFALVSGLYGCAASSDPDQVIEDAGAVPDEDAAAGCLDPDGDGWGDGTACEGDDCDEANPNRHVGCGENCDDDPSDVGCACDQPGEVRGCFDGDETLVGEGRCKAGLRTCEADSLWGPCVGEVLPTEEDPLGRNDVDDDCNGLVDDLLCGDVPDCGGDCCTGDEVCYGTYCDVPGDCAVDGNCDDDTHCTANGCVPYGAGDTNPDCDGDIVDPIEPIGEFEPDLQCQWEGDSLHNVIVPTLVVDLDPNLDEAIRPEIVFSATGNDLGDAHVVAIDGATCEERWRSDAGNIEACAPLAVGDVDGDGTIEIAAVTSNSGVALFDSEGEELWRTRGDGPTGCSILTPTLIANLDGVGDAEILYGLVAFDSAGDEIWRVNDPRLSPWGNVPVVADVDLDGAQEVVTGNRILSAADGGEEQFFRDLENGLIAIADFDASTPEPEIAVISNQSGARIQTITGEVIFGPVAIPGGGGGPPVIADFDGDGEAEFGAAGSSTYVVFDPDCANWARDGRCLGGNDDGIAWEKTTQDASSGATGSSVFDFDFDGVSEVVYNDECFTRVYDGLTGESRFVRSNSTGTAYEYPIIADVDGDLQTEIAVSANDFVGFCPDDAETGEPFGRPSVGVKVWRDIQDRWAPSRRVWNQHSYSVTNVDERGGIPSRPEDNWDVAGLNNFRVNTRDDPGSAERGVDLTVRGEDWDDDCPDRIVLHATVANRGIRRAPRGVAVSFSVTIDAAEPLVVCETRTVADIEPGASEAVACEWLEPQVFHDTDVHVLVDARVALTECEEENNDSVVTAVSCEGID